MMNRDLERLHDESHGPHTEITLLRSQNLELKMALAQTQAQLLQTQLRLVEEEFNRAKAQYDALKGKHEQDQG